LKIGCIIGQKMFLWLRTALKSNNDNHRSGGVFGSYQHADQVQRLRKLK